MKCKSYVGFPIFGQVPWSFKASLKGPVTFDLKYSVGTLETTPKN